MLEGFSGRRHFICVISSTPVVGAPLPPQKKIFIRKDVKGTWSGGVDFDFWDRQSDYKTRVLQQNACLREDVRRCNKGLSALSSTCDVLFEVRCEFIDAQKIQVPYTLVDLSNACILLSVLLFF